MACHENRDDRRSRRGCDPCGEPDRPPPQHPGWPALRAGQVSPRLAAAVPGPQLGVRGGRQGEALGVAAIGAIGVRCRGDPAPGAPDIVVGQLRGGI